MNRKQRRVVFVSSLALVGLWEFLLFVWPRQNPFIAFGEFQLLVGNISAFLIPAIVVAVGAFVLVGGKEAT